MRKLASSNRFDNSDLCLLHVPGRFFPPVRKLSLPACLLQVFGLLFLEGSLCPSEIKPINVFRSYSSS